MSSSELNQDNQPEVEVVEDDLRGTIVAAMEKSKEIEPEIKDIPLKEVEVAEPVIETPPEPKYKVPDGFSTEAKAKWSELPEVLQAEINKREADFHKMVTASDGELRLGREIKDVVSPYMPMIQAEGGTPATAVRDLLNTAYVLRRGTSEQKLAVIQTVCEQYGIDVGTIGQEKEYIDPTISQLQQEISRLKANADPEVLFKQLQQRQVRDNYDKEANAFASNPENKYFEKVRPIMATYLGEGITQNYKEAYDMACHAHPEIRSILEAEKKAAEQEKRKSEVAAKLNAASSITGSPATNSVSNASNQSDDLETTIRAAFRASSGKI